MLYHEINSADDEFIWKEIIKLENVTFITSRGLEYTYQIKRNKNNERLNEIIISRKEKTITRATILLAYQNAVEIMNTEGFVKGPKKLNVFGASYIYPVFIRLGLIKTKK